MGYKTLDDELLIILITEPAVWILTSLVIAGSVKNKTGVFKNEKYAILIDEGQITRCDRGDKFDKVIKHHEKENRVFYKG